MDFKKYFNVLNTDITYLDNAASSLKSNRVINKMNDYYVNNGSNVHRGVYDLSYKATDMYESSRQIVASFLNASLEEIVFTRGASSALNLVASSYGLKFINESDEILTTELEHHSSVLPWYNVCNIKGSKIKFIPLDSNGRITIENFKKSITKNTKVLAITHISNVMGYITDIKEIIKIAHENNIIVVLDACQSIPHIKVDVKMLDCDFLAFSGHKMCGPTGVGVLYGKKEFLTKMDPIEFGGDMALDVFKDHMTYKEIPYKFETGTPMIAEVIGLGEAIRFLEEDITYKYIKEKENILLNHLKSKLSEIKKYANVYNEDMDIPLLAFNIKDTHPHDAASVFDKNNICLRAGHHCAQLVTRFLKVDGVLRASFYFYNECSDIDKLVESIKESFEFFNKF